MFDNYTTRQLLELRSMCADTIEKSDDVQQRADTLLVLEHIEDELSMRQEKLSA